MMRPRSPVGRRPSVPAAPGVGFPDPRVAAGLAAVAAVRVSQFRQGGHPVNRLSIFLAVLGIAAAAGTARASGAFALDDPFAPPPTAEQIVADVLGETPALPGVGSDSTAEVQKTGDDTPFVDFGAVVIYENSLGIGTFVADDDQRRAMWDMMWSLRPQLYLFHKMLLVQARIDLNQPIIDNADAETTHNNEFTISDTILTITAPAFYKEPVTGLRFGAWMDFVFPSSLQSRYADLLLGWRTGVQIGGTWGPVDVLYQFRFTKNFHSNATPTLPFSQYGPGATTGTGYRNRGPGGELGEGISTAFNLMNRLTVTVELPVNLYLALDFVIFNSFDYDLSDQDQITDPVTGAVISLDQSQYAATGRGQSDLTQATLEFGWSPLKYLTVALGVSSYQPPFKDDNSGLRFPISFTEASANFTTVYLDVIGSY